MAPFKIGVTILRFLVFNLTINIVHTTPIDKILDISNDKDFAHDDYNECTQQIKFAFGNHFTSTGCFRYVVEHYKKGQYIPGTPEQKRKFDRDNYGNPTANYLPVLAQNYGEATSSYQSVQNYEELTSIYQPVQNYGGTSSIYQPVQNYGHLASINYQPEPNYGEVSSIYQPGLNSNVQSFDEQSQIVNQDDINGQSLDQILYLGVFDGIQDFIQKDFHRKNQSYNGQSSRQEEPTINVDDYQNPMLNSHAVLDIHRYGPNYAMEYYKVLETLMQGGNIDAPKSYCQKNFPANCDCLNALDKFGATSKTAVTVAFNDLILSECFDQYVYSYVHYIKENVNITRPSKMPKNFCFEIYKNVPWYNQLKGYI